MFTRTLAGHLKIRDGQILWADVDAHHLLGYAPGSLTDLPFAEVLEPPPVEDAAGIRPEAGAEPALKTEALSDVAVVAVPALGVVERDNVVLRGLHGEGLLVDMRAERMDDQSILWSFGLKVSRVRAERLDMLSRHDALTRLPNRIPTLEELQRAPHMHDSDPERLLAICYLDLDQFRNVNDGFGPVGGDAVLREVARRLKAAVPHDATVARVGGDEFALVMSFTSQAQCDDLIEQVLARLAHPFRLQERTTRIRVSVGVALMRYGEEPTEVLLQHARYALFFAKRGGGSQVQYFDASRALEQHQEQQIRQRIRNGLEQSEFVLAYQPKVDMEHGKVIGMEALVRWQHPQYGLLQPVAFVPLIEDHELVELLGDWVIGESMRQAAAWLDGGLRTSISVNISPRHLLRPDFIERLTRHLARYPQLQPGVLELEILETTAIKDFGAVADFILACKMLGVPVTLDDFGTGYSSLTYLRQLPVAALKLDQSFVRGMVEDAEDRAIVEGILVMAHGLGRKTIAEGVESVAHGDALMALGCTLGQGYGIARPMFAPQIPEWIAEFERAPPWGHAAPAA